MEKTTAARLNTKFLLQHLLFWSYGLGVLFLQGEMEYKGCRLVDFFFPVALEKQTTETVSPIFKFICSKSKIYGL